MTSIVSIVNSIYIFHISALFALNDVLQKKNWYFYLQLCSLHVSDKFIKHDITSEPKLQK